MTFCLDTNFLIDYSNANRKRHTFANNFVTNNQQERFVTPTVVMWEILRGEWDSRGKRGATKTLTELDWIDLISFKENQMMECAELWAELKQKGRPLNSDVDYQLAATARHCKFTLISRDKGFKHVDNLDLQLY